ncbi:LPS O-antigen chain length determinant protein WzzB [Gallibacterium melopsittaci]|uniref:LPS O-antigen chain length determinant protein WzzB n=1 Tax=Gallibacterium melopsittaci TaxID=516063 RepID=A0ABV6HTN6_9PAST
MEQQRAQNDRDDEIDLVELFSLLWKKKLTIFITTLVCVLIAAGYAFTAKERWTSKATVIMPTSVALKEYNNVQQEYARILGNTFDIKSLSQQMFTKFTELLYSLDERQSFLVSSDVYKQAISDGKTEEQQRSIMNEMVTKDISITVPDLKKDPNALGITISFSAESPVLAQNTLKKFIDTINQQAVTFNIDNFLIDYKEKIADLKFEQSKIQQDLEVQKKVKLEKLNKALEVATKAGITDLVKTGENNSELAMLALMKSNDTAISVSVPQTQLQSQLPQLQLTDNPYLFMLGTKYLTSQIEVVSSTNIIYPQRYYEIQAQLEHLEKLGQNLKNIKADAFTYLSSPDYPVVKDAPKRLLILLVGALLGLILSIIYIFINNIFSEQES